MGMFDGMIEKEAKKADLDHDGVPDMDQLGAIEKKAEHGLSVVVAAVDHDEASAALTETLGALTSLKAGVDRAKFAEAVASENPAAAFAAIDFKVAGSAFLKLLDAAEKAEKCYHPEDAKAGFDELGEALKEGQAYIQGVIHHKK